VILGLIFTAQSMSLIGPSTSFMYSNPSWSINGSVLIIIGVVLLSTAAIMKIRARDNLKRPK
jgi:hypothetical protein